MKKIIIVLFLASVLAACVTINIYFPAAAAQEAADKIIDDVWKIKEADAAQVADTPAEAAVE
jgi:PBP1b-binding outer membrane lipoprotein LpoB